MSIKLGNTDFSKAYVGVDSVDKIYLGLSLEYTGIHSSYVHPFRYYRFFGTNSDNSLLNGGASSNTSTSGGAGQVFIADIELIDNDGNTFPTTHFADGASPDSGGNIYTGPYTAGGITVTAGFSIPTVESDGSAKYGPYNPFIDSTSAFDGWWTTGNSDGTKDHLTIDFGRKETIEQIKIKINRIYNSDKIRIYASNQSDFSNYELWGEIDFDANQMATSDSDVFTINRGKIVTIDTNGDASSSDLLVTSNLKINIDAENINSYALPNPDTITVTDSTNTNYNGTYVFDFDEDIWYNTTNPSITTGLKGFFYFNDSASRWQFAARDDYAKQGVGSAFNTFLDPSPSKANGFWTIDKNPNWTAGNTNITNIAEGMSFDAGADNTITDLSGSGNDAILTNGMFNDTTPKNWEIDEDHGDHTSFITFGDIETFNAPQDFTLSIWLEFTAFDTTTGDADIFTKGSHNTNQPLLVWYDATVGGGADSGNSATISFMVTDDTNQHWIAAPSSSIVTNQVYNIVVQHNTSGRARIWINGVEKRDHTQSSTDGMKNNTDPLKIGAATQNTNVQDSDMKIYAFHAYDSFLTDAQITQNWNNLKGRFGL